MDPALALIIGFAVLHLLMFRPLATLVANTVLLPRLLLVDVAMLRGEMEGAQMPVCVAANMVGVALVLPIAAGDARFLEETTTPQL